MIVSFVENGDSEQSKMSNTNNNDAEIQTIQKLIEKIMKNQT
jgi:hypothetical protein